MENINAKKMAIRMETESHWRGPRRSAPEHPQREQLPPDKKKETAP